VNNLISCNTGEKTTTLKTRLPMKYVGPVKLLVSSTPDGIWLALATKMKWLF
jgi:hypothetical protein